MKDEMIEWAKTVIISLVIALLITTFIKPTIVKNYSMSPTLDENDFLIINRFLYKRGEPKRGDIVVFRSNLKTETGKQKLLIKRVIAIPGDKIVITGGKIYINGNELEESYIAEEYTVGDVDLIVPENEIFVMGDNRGNSLDSRDGILGPVDFSTVIGKAFVRIFPFNKIGLLK
ncbi:MAG: signal peptidase I [Natronincolaceae bacterium]|jgi:signal peptidase I|nr:signal peptidase I [Bacillota bacterium]NLK91199.1 signal peptidase I [Clostridiales bacterium]